MSGETLTERLAEAVEAWSWHEATDDTMAGYGFHMSQMLARLPIDSQTTDMQASINSMIADLTTLVTDLAAARAERDAAQAQVAAVEALHHPWWEADGVRHHHTVTAWGDEAPADHICRIGTFDACVIYPGEETEHQVLACVECQQAGEDGTVFPFWPCPTIAALDQPGQAVARIKAEALRQAAHATGEESVTFRDWWQRPGCGPEDGAALDTIRQTMTWLDARADAIESEAGQ